VVEPAYAPGGQERDERTKKTKETNQAKKLPAAPPAPDPVMYCGVLGEIVSAADTSTEADPVGVYASLLSTASVLVGSRPHVQIGNTRHPLLVWPLLFGRTGAGRKGEATETADLVVNGATLDMAALSVTGLSSGEGLIERIRDPRNPDDPGGVEDKRLRVSVVT
jgi:hypothetical protein